MVGIWLHNYSLRLQYATLADHHALSTVVMRPVF